MTDRTVPDNDAVRVGWATTGSGMAHFVEPSRYRFYVTSKCNRMLEHGWLNNTAERSRCKTCVKRVNEERVS